MQFTFTNELPASRLDEVVHYLLAPRLWVPRTDYPDFDVWAEKAHRELRDETKRALVALFGREIVGLTVYQRHKQQSDTLEIKNLTVRPDQRGRHIASFLLRNTEIEGVKDFKTRIAVCDAKAHNLPIRWFLARHRYRIAAQRDVYGKAGGDDLVYKKDIMQHHV